MKEFFFSLQKLQGRVWVLLAILLMVLNGWGVKQARATTNAPATAAASPTMSTATVLPGVPPDAMVAIVPVTGAITSSTVDFLRFQLDTSVDNGATLIVLDMNTPGGDLLAALKISEMLRSAKVPVWAWIHNEAYSAGILIASSCDGIIMSPVAVMGDCAPIQLAGGQWQSLLPTERAKVLSPLMAAFDANAKARGYDQAIFQAMCILDVRLYQIHQPETGQTRIVNQDDMRVMVKGEDFDKVSAEMSQTQGRPIGMSMTLATPKEQGRWVLVKQVHDGKTLLTVNQAQAQELGLRKAVAANTTELATLLGAKTVSTKPITWSQNTAFWLSSGWVRAILVVILILGLFVEFHAPGLGIGAIVAIMALGLLVVGPMLAGLAQWWQVIVVLVGVVLLLIEILFIPGFGLVGVIGLVMMFIGLTLMGVPTSHGAFSLPPSELSLQMQAAVLWMLLAIIASGVGVGLLYYYLGPLPIFGRLALNHSLRASMADNQLAHGGIDALPIAGASQEVVSGDEAIGQGQIKVGDVGRTLGILRPSGRAQFGDRVVDVLADGQWIELGARVKVIESLGGRIVVEEMNDTSA